MIKANEVKEIIGKLPKDAKVTLYEFTLNHTMKQQHDINNDEGTLQLKDNREYIITIR